MTYELVFLCPLLILSICILCFFIYSWIRGSFFGFTFVENSIPIIPENKSESYRVEIIEKKLTGVPE